MSAETMTPGDALEIYQAAHAELDNAIHAEVNAKDALITAIVLRKPLILTGLPGGGKSSLSEVAPYLVEDVSPSEVALISGQHDLTANQLIGGKIASEREVEDAEGTHTERSTTLIDGIVKPSTKIVRLEEMNGTNPLAIRSLLPVLENKRIENAAGAMEMPSLLTVIGTMNPTESRQSTFTISDAMASRFAVGAIMGARGSRQERLDHLKGVRALKKRMESVHGAGANPADIVASVVEVSELADLRTYVLRTAIDAATESKLDEMAIDTADYLDSMHISESDGRYGPQIETNAKALGGLRNKNHTVEDKDLHDAVRAVLLARLGALHRTDHLDIEAAVQTITKL